VPASPKSEIIGYETSHKPAEYGHCGQSPMPGRECLWLERGRTDFKGRPFSVCGTRGNFVDTADVYSEWITGNSGGESETIIGNWLQESGNRDRMVIATKVTKYAKRPGLGASNIKPAAPLDITDDITFSLGFGGANGAIDTLILQRCEERFSGGVNPNTPRFCPSRIACPAH
jgi:hypothetical protein